MLSSSKTLLFVAFTVAALIGAATSSFAFDMAPKFTLNLDLPPEQRWNGAVKAVVDKWGWGASFGPVLELYLPISFVVPANTRKVLYTALEKNYPDLLGELKGLYAQFDHFGNISKVGVNFEMFSLLAYGNEIEHYKMFDEELAKIGAKPPRNYQRACTGIVSLPPVSGNQNSSAPVGTFGAIHGRDMDESPRPGKYCTLDITATKGGKTIFRAFDWLWMSAGTETGMKPGAEGFSLELNYRGYFDRKNHEKLSWAAIEQRASLPKAVPALWAHRVAYLKNLTFGELVSAMQGQGPNAMRFICPFYTVASGSRRRGAIFTLHHNTSRIVVQTIDGSAQTPDVGPVRTGPPQSIIVPDALVQTNYDSWLADPANDPRRTHASEILMMLPRQRAGSDLGVWMAVSSGGVRQTSTMYSVLMQVDTGKLEGYLRRAMKPLRDDSPQP